jgi:hypothetical protein
MQSVPITTDVFSSSLDQGEVYNIMLVCQWLATGLWFSPSPLVSSTNKTDRYHITEILLKFMSILNNMKNITISTYTFYDVHNEENWDIV